MRKSGFVGLFLIGASCVLGYMFLSGNFNMIKIYVFLSGLILPIITLLFGVVMCWLTITRDELEKVNDKLDAYREQSGKK